MKLAKLEADAPREDVKYMRYEDMPPPSPEQEAKFDREFSALLENLFNEPDEPDEPDEPFGPGPRQSVQNWFIEMGAKIADVPEWMTQLYLDKFS